MKKSVLIAIIFLIAANFLHAQKELVWTVRGKMPYPVSHGQALFDGKNKIYILGGYSDSLQRSVDWIQEYDTDLNKWRMIGTMGKHRQKFNADFYQNKIWYFGGVEDFSANKTEIESWDYNLSPDPFVYDEKENFDRISSSGHVIGDNFYLIGGNLTPGSSKSSPSYIAEYNFAQKQFTWNYDLITTNKPQQHMTFAIGNNVYIFGGVYNSVLSSIRRFNISQKKLIDLPQQLPVARAGGIAVYNSRAKRGLIIGGYNETNNALATVEYVQLLFDDQLSFYVTKPMNFARVGAMAVNYENTVIVFGGKNSVKAEGRVVPEIEMLILEPTNISDNSIPSEITLHPNYPNPFNPSTTISFDLNRKQNVVLDIFTSLGERVTTLVNKEYEPGSYSIVWNGKNDLGNEMPSGVYIVNMRSNNFFKTRKMILVR